MKKILWIGFLFFVAGCVTMDSHDLYGVRIDYPWEDEDFQIQGVRGTEVDHTLTRSMNKDVTAWGQLKDNHVIILVENFSGKPIGTDYFFDKCTVVTRQGHSYQLKRSAQTVYQYGIEDQIHPRQRALFAFERPPGVNKDKIEKIVCDLGLMTGARIVLKPLP